MGVVSKMKRAARSIEASGCAFVAIGVPVADWERLVEVKGSIEAASDAVCLAVRRWVEWQIDPETIEAQRAWDQQC